jgi:hypothetical protein
MTKIKYERDAWQAPKGFFIKRAYGLLGISKNY